MLFQTSMKALIPVCMAFAAVFSAANAACTNPRVRSEWSTLNSDQKQSCKKGPAETKSSTNLSQTVINACVALTQRPDSSQYADPTIMSWHDFVITHSHNSFWAHGNAQFYLYHRAMLWQFEEALISTEKWPSTTGIPFFDWPAMSQNWWTSDIFSSSYFGAISSSDPDHCVIDGVFAKGKYSVAPDADGHRDVTSGDLKCLRRNAVHTAATDATFITGSLASTSFVQFTSQDPAHYLDETNFHADGHAILGGGGFADMSNPSVSPNDPLFYLHHGLVDKVYYRWQQQCEAFKYDYGGVLARADDPVSTGTATATTDLFVDSWPFKISQLLNTQGNTLCYTYARSGGDLPAPPVTCPKFTPVTDPPANTNNATNATASVDISDLWMTKLLIGMVGQAPLPTFGKTLTVASVTTSSFPATSTDSSNSAESNDPNSVVIFGRDAVKTFNAYFETKKANCTDISFTRGNFTISVPKDYIIKNVYGSHVTAYGPDGKPKRFYPVMEVIAHKPVDGAPTNVTPGSNPCYLAYPNPPIKEWVTKMNMNYNRMMNIHGSLLAKIDRYNLQNCSGADGPLSKVYQK
ncbi:hypothetical protein BC830DRAFT_278515 [Chytriomyces sp. MP71]|nr:hypothetical protein BC830DRAFT_278515 [Chytriomyces sp. MP71]